MRSRIAMMIIAIGFYQMRFMREGIGQSAESDPLVSKTQTDCRVYRKCVGCGCKGGPGYRSVRTHKCVGYVEFNSVCGSPPTTRCTFENEPHTGENRECVLNKITK